MKQQSSASYTGGCLCGAIRYKVQGPMRSIIGCHCRSCRRGSGHFVTATAVLRACIEITGEPRWYPVGEARRGFCPECGAFLFWDKPDLDRISVLAGSLDDTGELALTGHIYVAEKGDYYRIPEDEPCSAFRDANLQNIEAPT